MNTQKPKLLIYCDDFREITGFAGEVRPLLPFLDRVYEVHYFAVFGQTHDFSGSIKVYGSSVHDKNDPFGKTVFESVLQQVKPDLVFSNQDLQIINEIVVGPCSKHKIPLINWNIIDCEKLPEIFYQLALGIDWHIHQTKYAKNAIENQVFYVKNIDAPVIMPPINPEFFRSVPQKRAANGKKRILCVSKNAPRKYLTTLLDAVKLLEDISDKFELWLHVHNLSNTPTVDLGYVTNVKHRLRNVLFPTQYAGKGVLSDAEMVEIYRNVDLFVSPSGREGVGMPFLESMASLVPCVGVKHSATAELLAENRGVLLDPVALQYEEGIGHVTNAIVSPISLAKTIRLFVQENPDLILYTDLCVENGYNFAQSLRPELVSQRLIEQFNTCLNENLYQNEYINMVHLM